MERLTRSRGGAPSGVGIVALVAVLLAVGAAPAGSHVVVGRRTLRSWARDASVVVVAEVVDPVHTWVSADRAERRDAIRLRAVEVLRGDPGAGGLLVHPHAEGLPDWPAGARVLAFLEPSAAHSSLAPIAGGLPWYTTQGPRDAWPVGPGDDATLAAARAWIAAGRGAAPAVVRRTLLAELGARERRLREDALFEIVSARGDPALFATADDVAPFARLTDRSSPLPVAERIALARALDGAAGFDASAALRSLVGAWPAIAANERLALVRAAGQSRDPAISRWLAAVLDDAGADPALRREAAAALGHSWHAAQTPALERAARSDDGVLARRAAASLAAVHAASPAPAETPRR